MGKYFLDAGLSYITKSTFCIKTDEPSFHRQGPHLTSSSKWVVEPDYTEPRRVSFQGFPLLEEAEGSFGTKIQRIEKIEVDVLDEPHLSALSSRIVRQENPVASIFIAEIRLGGGLQSAQAFSILLQADRVYVVTLGNSMPNLHENSRPFQKCYFCLLSS